MTLWHLTAEPLRAPTGSAIRSTAEAAGQVVRRAAALNGHSNFFIDESRRELAEAVPLVALG